MAARPLIQGALPSEGGVLLVVAGAGRVGEDAWLGATSRRQSVTVGTPVARRPPCSMRANARPRCAAKRGRRPPRRSGRKSKVSGRRCLVPGGSFGKPPELDETGFVRVQLGKRGHPFLQSCRNRSASRWLEPDHEIIGVPHDDCVAFGCSGAPLLVEPQVEDIVQIDVRQNRRNNRTLRSAPKVIPPFAPFHDASIEPLDNQADNPPVADTRTRNRPPSLG